MTTKLIVFDLDGTIVANPLFYRGIYSGTLNHLVVERQGEQGMEMLRHCRQHFSGKGELALFALDIPFREWAEMLVNASLESLTPQPQLCKKIRDFRGIKVIYTGSPIEMALKILERIGFSPNEDFNLIVGWKEPEFFPTKWTCSSFVFEEILRRFSVSPSEAWAVGDVWDTDLLPAQTIGMKTALVGNSVGMPDAVFSTIEMFMDTMIGSADAAKCKEG